jgi:hypothetical protein
MDPLLAKSEYGPLVVTSCIRSPATPRSFTDWRFCRAGIWCRPVKIAVYGSGKVRARIFDVVFILTIFLDGECAQVLVHPAISVWTVSTLPNGDIVSGSSDKMVRIFSASEERWASAEDINAYEDVIAQQSLSSHDVEQVKVETMEALTQPGAFVALCRGPFTIRCSRQKSRPNHPGIKRRCYRSASCEYRFLVNFKLLISDLSSGTAPSGKKWENAQRDRLMARRPRPSLKARSMITFGASRLRTGSLL